MRHIWLRMSIVVFCALAAADLASAQATGTVTGAVKDSQGAVIPGATVALLSETRGIQVADVQTNGNGDFVFPNIQGDTYTVQVSLEGFKTLRRTGVFVSPGDRVVVPTVTLSLGGLNETVDVKAEA